MNQPASPFRLNLAMVLGTMLLHGLVMVANEVFFRHTEFLQGIGWIYLPAGTRLLCTLLFGRAGALGLLLAGWIACYVYYFPGDALRATTGSLAATAGPYLVYLIARRRYGLQASLGNLTPRRLLLCALGCAIASPLLHHLWFALHGDFQLLPGFGVMIVGDLAGTLIVVYTGKALLTLLPGPAPRTIV
ncbi:MAG: hypothetical protein K2P77_12360 [Burkholderiaceae bacterium]|nr:hypothetical protein [Burkholderiaceae bacterium]